MQPAQTLPNENYNLFFHSNVCHVCKCPTKLMECPLCAKISYCSENHRLLHWPQHKEICEAIVKAARQRNFYDSRGLTLPQWTDFKKENMKSVKQQLSRNLEPYEEQMFIFAKSCLTCRQQICLPEPCRHCFSVNMCSDHNSDSYEHSCQQLRICLDLDIRDTKNDKINLEEIRKYVISCAVHDMSSFIQEYLERNRSSITWTSNDFASTNYFSQPLTLFHGLRRARLLLLHDLTGHFVIHIITRAFTNIKDLSYWEIFLHAFYADATLMLIIIGPGLQNGCDYIDVCKTCRNHSRLMQYQHHDMYYHDYVGSLLYTRPNVIVGYHAEFNQRSVQIMKAMQRQRCPILLTFKSKDKAQENIMKIRKMLDLPLIPILNERNKFASCRPYRSYDNDSVVFLNQHLIIYSDLG